MEEREKGKDDSKIFERNPISPAHYRFEIIASIA